MPNSERDPKRGASDSPLSAAKPSKRTAADEYADDGSAAAEEAWKAVANKELGEQIKELFLFMFVETRKLRNSMCLGVENIEKQIELRVEALVKPVEERMHTQVSGVSKRLAQIDEKAASADTKADQAKVEAKAMGDSLRKLESVLRSQIAAIEKRVKEIERDQAAQAQLQADLSVTCAGLKDEVKQIPLSYAAVAAGGAGPSHAHGAHAPLTVEQALRRESSEHSCELKMQGFVKDEGAGMGALALRRQLENDLSTLAGCKIEITAVRRVMGKDGRAPFLRVKFGSFEEADAVWKLRGANGAAGKLKEGQIVKKFFGFVEMSVRTALWAEVERLRKEGKDAWLGRSSVCTRIDNKIVHMPLTAEAIAAGLLTISKGGNRHNTGAVPMQIV